MIYNLYNICIIYIIYVYNIFAVCIYIYTYKAEITPVDIPYTCVVAASGSSTLTVVLACGWLQ